MSAQAQPGGDRRGGAADRRVGRAEVVREFFDAMPTMLAGLEGPELRFAAANRAYREFVGRGDLIGLPVREVFPEAEGQQIYELFDRVYATGRPESAREWRMQLALSEGGEPEEIFLDFDVYPRHDQAGAVTGLSVFVDDVTHRVRERRATQHRAAEAQRRYRAARDVVAELQEALLPVGLPVLPRVELGARYLVAEQDQAAGGDWFDAIPVTDGRVALVVGDVVGHGVAAAAAMGRLRTVVGELLTAETDLATALTRVDAFAARDPALRAATLAAVILDPATGDLSYSLCGHPAPLLVGADGSVAFLVDTGTGPLGTGHVPSTARAQLAPGELILLYSDGLIERPNRTLREGAAELAVVAADAAGNRALPRGAARTAAERVCQLTVELLTRTGYTDDVTTLAAQLRPEAAAPFHIDRTAEPASLAEIRTAFYRWLDGLHVGETDRHRLGLAVGEAVTNAIEHAYRRRPRGPVRMDAELWPDGMLECRISDQGSWRVPDATQTTRGRGLLLCERLLEEFTVTHPPQRVGDPAGSRGTVVTVRHRVRRPALLAPDTGSAPVHREHRGVLETELVGDGDPPVLRVAGPVDMDTAVEFATALSAASRGGVLPVTLDLSRVTQLASAGVRALFEAREQLGAHRRSLTLLAPAGSAAAVVLDLVEFPYGSETVELPDAEFAADHDA